MKLEQKEKSLLFSETIIPDIFFSEHLSELPGDYLKIYMYILFLSKYGKDIKLTDLSKKLNIPLKIINDGIKFLEEHELITKKTNGYIIVDLQESTLHNLYTPNLSLSKEKVEQTAKNKTKARAIEHINNMYFQGIMGPSWYNDIDLWFSKYGFDEEVMLALFNYAYEKRALHRNYIQATAEAWNRNGIKTFNDLDLYFEKSEKRNSLNNEISKKLNLYRKLTTYEEEDIAKWTEVYNYKMDIIEIALKKASSNNKVRFDYIDAMITDWHSKDLHTPEEVLAYIESTKNNNKDTKRSKNSRQAQSFEYTQSTFDNLNDLYDN